MALHLYIEKEKLTFASKDIEMSFDKAEIAIFSTKPNRLLLKTERIWISKNLMKELESRSTAQTT